MIVRRGLLGAVLLAAVLALAGCALMRTQWQSPRVSLVALRLQRASLFQQQFVVTLKVVNPNDAALPVKSMDYRFKLNGKAFASGLTDKSFTVPAFGQTKVRVSIDTTTLGWARQLALLDRGHLRRLSYHVYGTVHVGSWFSHAIAFSYHGKVALPAGAGASAPASS